MWQKSVRIGEILCLIYCSIAPYLIEIICLKYNEVEVCLFLMILIGIESNIG